MYEVLCLSTLFKLVLFFKVWQGHGSWKIIKTQGEYLWKHLCVWAIFLMCSCRGKLYTTGVHVQRNQPQAGKQCVCTPMRRTMTVLRFLRTSGPQRPLFLHLDVKKLSEHWYDNRKVNSTDRLSLISQKNGKFTNCDYYHFSCWLILKSCSSQKPLNVHVLFSHEVNCYNPVSLQLRTLRNI